MARAAAGAAGDPELTDALKASDPNKYWQLYWKKESGAAAAFATRDETKRRLVELDELKKNGLTAEQRRNDHDHAHRTGAPRGLPGRRHVLRGTARRHRVRREGRSHRQPTLTARFPIYDKVSASSATEATDFTTNVALDTSGTVDVTVSRKGAALHPHRPGARRHRRGRAQPVRRRAEARDRRVGRHRPRRRRSAAAAAGPGRLRAVRRARLLDRVELGPADHHAADQRHHAAEHEQHPDRSARRGHPPKQWQALLPIFDDASMFGAQGAEIIKTGAVGNLYGCLIFETNNVTTATVSSSTVYAGAIMHPSAIALAQKGSLPMIETERDASLRATEIVATGVWGGGGIPRRRDHQRPRRRRRVLLLEHHELTATSLRPARQAWTLAGTKLDLKAIYRRPRRSVGEYDEIVQERSAPTACRSGTSPARCRCAVIATGWRRATSTSRSPTASRSTRPRRICARRA
jgi:hypothetical protein